MIYFNGERDYFECHEVLEEYWKAHPQSELSEAWVGLIQVAVGIYHQRRGNMIGAFKMLSSAVTKLIDEDLARLGIDGKVFRDMLRNRVGELVKIGWESFGKDGGMDGIKNGKDGAKLKFKDMNIPLQDEALLEYCIDICAQKGVEWGQPSDMQNNYLIHKHSRRDRSDVIAERQAELAKRKALRN